MKKVISIILDGWGIGEEWEHNPIFLAHTPNMDSYLEKYPHTHLGAGGEAIGLPQGHQGASEIGHYIIGAGRNALLPQNQALMSVETRGIKRNPAYLQAVNQAKKNKSALHLLGLLSNSGVHSYDVCCHALIEMAAEAGVKDVFVHAYTDGRDTEPKEALVYLQRLEEQFKKSGLGQVATVMGRYWSMDRDHRWERVEKAYLAMVKGHAEFKASSAHEAIEQAYKRDETDEFIKPTVIVDKKGDAIGPIKDGDTVILFNFRTDRAIELTQALIEEQFEGFIRSVWPKIFYVATCEYYQAMKAPVAFKRPEIKNSLGEVLAQQGLKQLRISETEKWVYLTTIFNGMQEEPFKGEERILIPSDKIATYDLKPEMKALEIAEKVVKLLPDKEYQAIFINFANPDILGHTGKKPAIIKGIETVDSATSQVVEAGLKHGYNIIVTADHGDAEIVWNVERNCPHTYHTDSDVPFFLISKEPQLQKGKLALRPNGILADIAPTILKLLNIKQPREMTGKTLY